MLVTFQGVSLWGCKAGKCGCGKRRSRKREFSQSLNPFNLSAGGQPKTRGEIYAELRQMIEAWQREPIVCKGCPPATGKDALQVAGSEMLHPAQQLARAALAAIGGEGVG